jgi:hypothetical protein
VVPGSPLSVTPTAKLTFVCQFSRRKTLTIDERLSQLDPGNMQARQDVADGHAKIGDLLITKNSPDAALLEHVGAMKLRKEVSEKDRENADALRDLARSYSTLGDVSI